MRGIPSQCRPGPSLSGPSSAGFYAVFPAPSQQGASLPSFKSFHQTHFFGGLPSQAQVMHTLVLAVLLGTQHVAGTPHL